MKLRSKSSKLSGLVAVVSLMVFGEQALAYCSEPVEPSCIDMLSMSRDQFSVDMCRLEVESYISDMQSYVECVQRDASSKVDEQIDRYNCYARGESFCP